MREGRLFDPAVGGGAILDMGGYPVSVAIAIARWAGETERADLVSAEADLGPTGVDESAVCTLRIGTIAAELAATIVDDAPASTVVEGTRGTLTIDHLLGSRTRSGSSLVLQRTGEAPITVQAATVNPLASEADAVGRALQGGSTEALEMPWEQSAEIARVLAVWRASITPGGGS